MHADVVHRITMAYRQGVNPRDYDPAEWIINPDLSSVAGLPRKYWSINGDQVVGMGSAEQSAVDESEVAT